MLYPAELQARAVILAGERASVNFRYPRRVLKRARSPLGHVLQVRRAYDVATVERGARAVARHLHCDALGYARPHLFRAAVRRTAPVQQRSSGP